MCYLSEPQPFELWHIFYLLSLFLTLCMSLTALLIDLGRSAIYSCPKPLIIMSALGVLYTACLPIGFPVFMFIHFVILLQYAPLGAFIIALILHVIMWLSVINAFCPFSAIRNHTKNMC